MPRTMLCKHAVIITSIPKEHFVKQFKCTIMRHRLDLI